MHCQQVVFVTLLGFSQAHILNYTILYLDLRKHCFSFCFLTWYRYQCAATILPQQLNTDILGILIIKVRKKERKKIPKKNLPSVQFVTQLGL